MQEKYLYSASKPLTNHFPFHDRRFIIMYQKLTLPLLALLCTGNSISAQTTQDEIIKSLVTNETTSYYAKDSTAWEALWAHDPTASAIFVWPGQSSGWMGWDSIRAVGTRGMRVSSSNTSFANKNYVIRKDANLATVDYQQTITRKLDDSVITLNSSEHRVLVKTMGKWKIITLFSRTTGVNDEITNEGIESSINTSGYNLLSLGKTQDAIKLFILNTQLFPNAWNTYDSLGEAYLIAGEKEKAKQNYEKSVQLNPKNKSGKLALEKL